MTRASLDAEVLEWIAQGALGPADEARFDRLARSLFSWQREHNAPYRRMCEALYRPAEEVSHWSQIPSAPTGAFKEARLASFPEEDCIQTFESSGSTSGARSQLHLDTLALYDASLRATFGAFVCPDVEKIRFLVLAPPCAQASSSSLSYMFDAALRLWGTADSAYGVDASGLDVARTLGVLESACEPVAVVGTAFAFVHLLDSLEEHGTRVRLAEGSRVLETGGFKGRSRVVERDALHRQIASRLGVPLERIVNQYGMSELATQFYEPTLRTQRRTPIKQVPPWVRCRAVDPETLRDVAPGEPGLLIHYDLANTGSVLAVQTSDLGRVTHEGLEVIGRLPGAEARGCSIAADLLLGRG